MGETNFHFFSFSLNGKMALDILGIRMELGHGMSYLHPWAASASKQKQKKKQKETHPTKQKHLRWFSGLDLWEGDSISVQCRYPPQQLFVYSRKSHICWTSSNSLVLGVQKPGVRVTCVQLVHLAFLKKYLLSTAGMQGTLWILSLSSPLPLSSQFSCLFLGSQ